MLIIVGVLLLSLLLTTRLNLKTINVDYSSKQNTLVIKGFFVICVFLSHIRTYTEFTYLGDDWIIHFLDLLGQLMVTLFLFYSGYGVLESIKIKGKKYINNFPSNRIKKTFFDFSFAIILFLILGAFLEKSFSTKQVLLSFTGWTSVGNSNWYMFAIFTLYIITYLSFKVSKNKPFISICFVTVLSLLYVYIMSDLQPSRFSNTYLCYAGGMWFSYFKPYLDKFFMKYNLIQYLITIALLILFVWFYPHRSIRLMYYNFESMVFCLLVVFISMRFSFKSKILTWFGNYLFWVYILQRIPMILLQYYGITDYSPMLFLFLTLFITMGMSVIVQKLMNCLKDHIWHT